MSEFVIDVCVLWVLRKNLCRCLAVLADVVNGAVAGAFEVGGLAKASVNARALIVLISFVVCEHEYHEDNYHCIPHS